MTKLILMDGKEFYRLQRNYEALSEWIERNPIFLDGHSKYSAFDNDIAEELVEIEENIWKLIMIIQERAQREYFKMGVIKRR